MSTRHTAALGLSLVAVVCLVAYAFLMLPLQVWPGLAAVLCGITLVYIGLDQGLFRLGDACGERLPRACMAPLAILMALNPCPGTGTILTICISL